MIKLLWQIAVALVSVLSSTSYADDAWLTLQKAAQAAHDLSYDGIYSYHLAGLTKSAQITHINYGQGEYARVVVLDGRPREALIQGDDTVYFNQDQEKIVIEKRRGQQSFPAVLPNNLDLLKSFYQAQVLGSERVAGREAQIVLLQPKDQYRYGYKFWVDKEFGLLLRSSSLDQQGNLSETISFTQVLLTSGQNLDWFRPSQLDASKNYQMQKTAMSNLQDSEMNCDLPNELIGYQRINQVKHQLQHSPSQRTHLLYSDGLASVSIFVEPMVARNHPRVGYKEVGNTSMLGAIADGHQIMVVGNVPQVTVNQFVNAVKIKKK